MPIFDLDLKVPVISKYSLYILLFLSIVINAHSFGNEKEKGLLTIHNFTPQDYKAHPQNWSIIQDQRGIMYFGNNIGVLEYDGVNWKLIKVTNETNVRSLALDTTKNRIYVGARDEFGFLAADSTGNIAFHSLLSQLNDTIDVGEIWNTHVIKDKVIFELSHGILIWNGEKIDYLNSKNEVNHTFIVGEQLLVHTDAGELFKLNKKNEFELLTNTKIESNFSVSKWDDKTILLTKKPPFLLINQDLTIESFPFNTEATNSLQNARNLNFISKNKFSISTTKDGVHIFNTNGKLLQVINSKSGLQDDIIFHQFLDNQNNLWLATSNGISKIDINSPLSIIDKKLGLNSTIEAITRHNNKLVLATHGGLFELQTASSEQEYQLPKLQRLSEKSIEYWDILSFNNEILLVADNNNISQLTSKGEKIIIEDIYPWCIYRSQIDSNRIFVGADPGFFSIYFKNNNWEIELLNKEIDAVIRKITEDKNGNIYLGTDSEGLIKLIPKYADYKLVEIYDLVFDTSKGLPDGFCFAQIDDKWTFIGTNEGLYRFNKVENKYESDTIMNKLFQNGKDPVVRLSVDPSDNLWIVSVNKEQKVEVGFVEKQQSLTKMLYNNTPFNEISEFLIYAIHHDHDGITWLGGPNGLFRYDANAYTAPISNFPVSIRKVAIRNDSVIFSGTYYNEKFQTIATQTENFTPILTYKNNSISFDYAAQSYQNTESNLYSYKLEGFEYNWSDWKSETKTVYTNLPEGDYVFRVKAINKFKQTSNEAIYRFTILPPWYRTIWAYIAYFLGFAGFVRGAIVLSTRGLKAIIDEKTAEVVKQKEEIEAKNATLEQANEEILEQKDIIEEKNKDIMDSINYAEKIQSAILPKKELKERILPDSFVLFMPKDIVSGDFYWMAQKNNVSYFSAADCTGHGVPGAFMSMIGTSLLNQTINEANIIKPSEILDNVKAGIIKALDQGEFSESKDGMDAALCAISLEKLQLQFSGGNNPVYIIRKGDKKLHNFEGKEIDLTPYLEEENIKLYEIKASKMPIAYYPGMENERFENHEIQLEKGDTIYVSSDGYPDQFGGPRGKKFKYKTFKELLISINDKPMGEQKTILNEKIVEWMSGYEDTFEQIDDICVIGVRV